MNTKEKNCPPQTAPNKTSGNQNTRTDIPLSSKRAERIAKRRADMTKIYRPNYDRAVSGKSLRAAVNAFCLECMMWQRVEVRLCTSLACPLWVYRPYQHQQISEKPSEASDFLPESTNSEQGSVG